MKPRVLLVEDELLLREMTRGDLEDLGFEVLCAKNGDEALALLAEADDARVLITDIRMPGEHDGWSVARHARSARPDMGVIYISGYSAEEPQPVEGSIFLKKPYRLHEIEEALGRFGLP